MHPELAAIYAEDGLIKRVVRRAVGPGTNAVDIGAHYGTMLSAILRRSPKGQHTAFEAIPTKAAFLRQRFPEVKLHECALGEAAGSVDFFINTKQSGYSSLARHGDDGDTFQKIQVECDTLDSRMRDAPPVQFLKVDVEGAEEQVLRGGREFLGEHGPVILFECGPSGAAAFGREPVGVFDALVDELGYEVFLMTEWLSDGAACTRGEFEEALVYPFRALNWVAQKRS